MPHKGNIQGRLGRLEERGARCPDCGLAPGERREIAVINEEHPDKSLEGDPDEACVGCGQPLYCVLKVVYGSPEVDEGGRG
jgi:hypothetical protein